MAAWLEGGMSDDYSAERVERDVLALERARSGVPEHPHTGSFVAAPDRLDDELAERLADDARALKYYHPFFDDCLRALLPTDLVLLGAPTGLGKTDLALNIATSNALKGKRAHYFALEAEPRELERRTKFAMLSAAVYAAKLDDRYKMNYADWRLGRLEYLCGQFNESVRARFDKDLRPLWTFYRGNKFDAQDLERHVLAIREQTDLIIIDHLHYIDAQTDRNEAEAIGATVKTIRDLSLNVGKPVILIAHLRKKEQGSKRLIAGLDDFHGSSNITKICTQAITIERCHVVQPPKWYLAPTFMTVLKDRRSGAPPFVALTNFDRRVKGYQKHYTLGRLTKGGSDWEPLSIADKPDWAVHHKPLDEAGSNS
jgi:hypothetical protein